MGQLIRNSKNVGAFKCAIKGGIKSNNKGKNNNYEEGRDKAQIMADGGSEKPQKTW